MKKDYEKSGILLVRKQKNLYDCKGVSWSFSHKIGRYIFVFQCAKYLKN